MVDVEVGRGGRGGEGDEPGSWKWGPGNGVTPSLLFTSVRPALRALGAISVSRPADYRRAQKKQQRVTKREQRGRLHT